MTEFELLPEGADANAARAHQLVWPADGRETPTVRAAVDPWLRRLGTRSNASIDLVRIAAGAYMADRLSPRRTGFSRTIRLHVRLINTAGWGAAAEGVADLLHWLTADTWRLNLADDGLARPDPDETPAAARMVALFSGGLDSFCGALLASKDESRRLVGHWDNPTVKAAQDRSWAWMTDDGGLPFAYEQIRLSQTEQRREGSTRSRSLLFIALALAVADGVNAQLVEVPENGFTSLNPPLGANRGGALSTRSTHPWTLHLVRRLLDELGIGIELHDPHMERTKGDLLAATVAAGQATLRQGAARTLSCGKLDGRLYRGGNPNHHCGLCVPCLVRRGAFIAAGLADETPYLINELTGAARQQLLDRRSDDIAAVRYAIARDLDDVDLIALGPFPDDFDLDAALDLCSRGMRELAAVPLP
jgi:hypothetical protein